MKRLLVFVAVVAAALATALPAAADPPIVYSFEDMGSGINPCTGQPFTVTVKEAVYITVPGHTDHATRTITTSDGFVGRGQEVSVFDGTLGHIIDTIVNPQTGQRLRLQFIVAGNPQDPQVLVFTSTCLDAGAR